MHYGAAFRRACRTIALRVACTYRTVSDIVLSVVAELPPLDLMACKGAEVYREGMIREEGDFDQGPRRNRWSSKSVEEWQRRWDTADKGRWTHRIIPCVLEWTESRHELGIFHLTQILTRHGCFRSYLKRIGMYESAECPTCPETDEDVGHVLSVCPRFWEERERLRALWEGPLTPEGIGRCLLSSQRGWDAVIGLATEVVDRLNSIRREEERRGSRLTEDQAV